MAKPAPVTAPAGLRVWFTDTGIPEAVAASNEFVGQNGNADAEVNIEGIYKGETDRNGNFSVTGLPANTMFRVTVNNFVHTVSKETFYFNGKKLYLLETDPTLGGGSPTSYGEVKTQANGSYTVLPIVLYAEKEVVFASAYKAGSLAEPLVVHEYKVLDARNRETTVPSGKIEVTFTDALEPSSFSAYLVDDATTARGFDNVKLKAVSWSADKKTVTLDAAGKPANANYGTTTLPYNVFAITTPPDQEPTGHLVVTAAKADGTEAYIVANVPVYTEEKIKLLSVEVLEPSEAEIIRPSRSIFTVKLQGAVKLTFSKPIAAHNINTDFWFENANHMERPDYQIVDNVAYVYIDQKIIETQATRINYKVVSNIHSDDFIAPTVTTDGFTTDGLQRLVVSSANLYDPNPDVGIDAAGTQNGASFFPIDDAIEITFTRNIVEGTVEAELFHGQNIGQVGYESGKLTNKVAITTEIVDNTVTITPAFNLEPNTAYYLSLTVKDKAGDVIYTTERGLVSALLLAVNPVHPGHLVFTTAQKKLLLTNRTFTTPCTRGTILPTSLISPTSPLTER